MIMTETHLTKRETDVMEIFWAHDEDLSARDIQQYLPDITVNSIQPVLKRLQKKEYIHVSGFSQHTKSLMRVYRPLVSKAQHIVSLMDQHTSQEILLLMVKQCKDKTFLEELQGIIAKKLK